MTVCIAALCDNGKGVVLAADQMVTARIPIGYEFEHQEITKIVPLDDEQGSTYALAAGDVLLGTKILDQAKIQVQQQQRMVTATEIAEIVRGVYQSLRLSNIVQKELEPRGLDIDSYYGRHQSLSPQVLLIIDQSLSQWDAGVEFIIAGRGEAGYTIHTVINPGITVDNTPLGYCAIGSGAPHAMYSLIEARYTRGVDQVEVEKLVRKAKGRSEVAPGVGSETQLRVIHE